MTNANLCVHVVDSLVVDLEPVNLVMMFVECVVCKVVVPTQQQHTATLALLPVEHAQYDCTVFMTVS